MTTISQETFDDMVRENMEDFDMEKKEALAETISQLTSMGKDLSSIDTTGGEGREEILAAIRCIRELKENKNESIEESIRTLCSKCSDKHEFGKRNQSIFRINGGMIATVAALETSLSDDIVKSVCDLIITVCRTNIENRDLFEPFGSEKLCAIINRCLESFSESENDSAMELLHQCLKCARVVAKSENNKVALMHCGLSNHILSLLRLCSDSIDSLSVGSRLLLATQESCLLLKCLCTHDDTRREMSCAYDNGRRLLSDGFVEYLMLFAGKFATHQDLGIAALSAVRQVVLSEEAVKAVAKFGAMTLPRDVLSYPAATVPLIRSVLGLARNLCADDERKNSLVSDGTLQLLVDTISRDENASDAILMEHAFACLAAMALRFPNNACAIVNLGAVDEIVSGMQRHADKPALQRQACLTIRNIAARSPELRPRMLDCGVENALRMAGRVQSCVDEAYGALRDLGCDVQYVTITEGGQAESAYQQFGSAGPLKFNPVFDETSDIEQRVSNKASAPFTNSDRSVFRVDEEDEDEDEVHTHSENCQH